MSAVTSGPHVVSQSLFALVAATTAEGWRPGIGDPTLLGWITVVAYVVAGGICMVTAHRMARMHATRHIVFWWGLALLLVLLAVNKQLDLQSFFTQTGKQMAQDGGWYEQRRSIQVGFIVGISMLFGAIMLFCVWSFRYHWHRYLPVLLGLTWLCLFIVIRAASFHKVDALIAVGTKDLKMNHLFELGGIAVILFGAWYAARDRQLTRAADASVPSFSFSDPSAETGDHGIVARSKRDIPIRK